MKKDDTYYWQAGDRMVWIDHTHEPVQQKLDALDQFAVDLITGPDAPEPIAYFPTTMMFTCVDILTGERMQVSMDELQYIPC